MTEEHHNEVLIKEEDFATGLAELQLRRLIEYHGEDDIRLTDSGLDRAFDMWFAMTPAERLVMTLFMDTVAMAKDEEKQC